MSGPSTGTGQHPRSPQKGRSAVHIVEPQALRSRAPSAAPASRTRTWSHRELQTPHSSGLHVWWRAALERFVVAAVQTLAPVVAGLSERDRLRAQADVSRFVVGQVQRMPRIMGWPLSAALVALDRGAILRYRRPFYRLDHKRRQEWLDTWGDSTIGPVRDVVKLLRSCTLLSWYDHRLVAQAMQAIDGMFDEPASPADNAGDEQPSAAKDVTHEHLRAA